MKPHKFKAVSYSYPSSSNAVHHGFGKTGCYTVETFDTLSKFAHQGAFSTIDEAYQHAATLPQIFHWTDIRTYEENQARQS